jgi:hypothetical protein
VSKFVVTDVFGNTVIGSFAAWDHAVRGHPELKDKESLIEMAIASPTSVHETSNAVRYAFRGATISSGFWSNSFPIAVVQYRQKDLGYLITAYLTTTETRGSRKWP